MRRVVELSAHEMPRGPLSLGGHTSTRHRSGIALQATNKHILLYTNFLQVASMLRGAVVTAHNGGLS
jgi:hypothetical protein